MKQIFPDSITGKGGRGLGGPAASVLDHRFGQSDPFTLGVEEEYMLLDPETWDLVQHIDSVLAAVEDGEHSDHLHAELMQSVLEVTTPVCRTAGDVSARSRSCAPTSQRSPASRAAASGPPGRTRSASPSGSASRPAIVYRQSSTNSSTWRGAS
jgi:hypothetical protein